MSYPTYINEISEEWHMLTAEQEEATRIQLRENLEKSGLTIEQVSADLGTTPEYIEQLLRLEPKRIEDTWILRNYLIRKVKETGQKPVKFTALGADHHIIWFLDSRYIDGRKIKE